MEERSASHSLSSMCLIFASQAHETLTPEGALM
jgi:hypothetical protein